MKKIVVIGVTGQLGKELQNLTASYREPLDLTFLGKDKMDLSTKGFSSILNEYNFEYLINAAAYTKVDHAESHVNECYQINTDAVEELAKYCHKTDKTLIHISSDYVYHNYAIGALTESSPTLPKGVYARSKYYGEKAIEQHCEKFYIFRTSWLYSIYGNNFVKTMLSLSKKLNHLRIVNDQIGAPTHAATLAEVILLSIRDHIPHGIYNVSDDGFCSWYNFAQFIFQDKSIDISIEPISSEEFGAPAPRPNNSILDNSKLLNVLPNWERMDWETKISKVLRKL